MSRPLRVLHILHHANRAGTERHVLYLCTALRELGWDARVVWSRGGPMEHEFAAAGVPADRVRRLARLDPGYLPRMIRRMRTHAPDLVHAHSGRSAALAARIAGVRAIVETRHGLGDAAVRPAPFRMRSEVARCRLAHRTIVVTRSDYESLVRSGLEPRRLRVIDNGIPLPQWLGDDAESRLRAKLTANGEPQEQASLRVGFLGRMAPQKDPLFLVGVADAWRAAGGTPWWFIAGEGPLGGPFRAGLAAAAGETRVRWLGRVDREEELLREVDVLAVPSRWEGQPLAVLEAMGAGVVVAACDIPAMRDLLGGDPPAGLLLARDPAAWARGLDRLRRDSVLRAALRREARRRVEDRHCVGMMVGGVIRVYEEILVGGARA